jgi:hypothetical protein
LPEGVIYPRVNYSCIWYTVKAQIKPDNRKYKWKQDQYWSKSGWMKFLAILDGMNRPWLSAPGLVYEV